MAGKPRVGVSRCLLGDAVRYDGDSKPCAIVIDQLSQQFELVAVCPEVEAGLSIPRPPVRLSGSLSQPRLIGRDNPELDITELMHAYCTRKVAELDQLDGFIFKSRSPSCGLNSTPVFIDGEQVSATASGVFAQTMRNTYPDLPVIEETGLESRPELDAFIEAVCNRQ